MDVIQRIAQSMIKEAHEDFVGLWLLVGALELALPEQQLSDTDVRNLSLRIVESMLSDDNIRAGDYTGDITKESFTIWEMSTPQIIERIEDEWKRLGVRSPHPFLIVSFAALPLIKRLNERG